MSRRTTIAVASAASALVLLLFITLGYLWTQRASLTAELAVTAATLTETKDHLAQTEGTLDETKDVLRSTETTLATTQATLDVTHADLVESRTHLNEKITALAEATNNLVTERERANALQTEVNAARGDIRTLEAGKVELEHAQSVLTQEHEHLQSLHAGQTQDLQNLRQEHSRLRSVNGTIAEANGRVQWLQGEIARLERLRQPLILRDGVNTHRSGFYCSGSMEPKVTCLDEATYLHNYKASDIGVGAIISFEGRVCYSSAPVGARWSHRVMDIRVSGNGTYYFWTKGDANRSGDCWVPHTAVDSYMIAIHKNVRPENARLRDGMNGAKARLDAADTVYVAHREAHGCYDPDAVCYFSSRTAYNKAVRLRGAWEAAWDYYQCWRRNVEDSEYPGHIPYTC